MINSGFQGMFTQIFTYCASYLSTASLFVFVTTWFGPSLTISPLTPHTSCPTDDEQYCALTTIGAMVCCEFHGCESDAATLRLGVLRV